MKTRRSVFTLAVIAVLALAAPAMAQSGPSASGHSSTGYDGFEAMFSFNVREVDGVVRGEFQNSWYDPGTERQTFIHGTLDCLRIEGNHAWASGVVTISNEPELYQEGLSVVWVHVVDNGEGKKAARDQWSDLWIDVEPLGNMNDCTSNYVSGDFAPDIWNAYGGNFQVRP